MTRFLSNPGEKWEYIDESALSYLPGGYLCSKVVGVLVVSFSV